LASPSARVVYAALAGDLAVASAKFGAAALSGSSVMFSEAIHSLVDSADQLLLLSGQYRARKPPDNANINGERADVRVVDTLAVCVRNPEQFTNAPIVRASGASANLRLAMIAVEACDADH
jgi:hypothetical protein